MSGLILASVYLLGVVVVAICTAVRFAHDSDGPLDLADAAAAVFFGFGWPILAPFVGLALIVMVLVRKITGRAR